MGPNLNRQKLYGNLIRSVYVLKGIDGEFVASLCERIPFKPKAWDWAPSGVLAVIPSNRVAALQGTVEAYQEAIVENRADAQSDWGNDGWVSCCFRVQQEFRAELAKAEAELARV
jgi:hypothetical protein